MYPGGDLATQLARWGRLGRDRTRFYAAEIVEGVEGLHAAGILYRDLKPEHVLIGANGHIVLTDFGLSKGFPRWTTSAALPSTPSGSLDGEFHSSVLESSQPTTPPWLNLDKTEESAVGWPGPPAGHNHSTNTFCGTAEYVAPELIQGVAYSYEVDWWSFGTMLYEMLTGSVSSLNNHVVVLRSIFDRRRSGPTTIPTCMLGYCRMSCSSLKIARQLIRKRRA